MSNNPVRINRRAFGKQISAAALGVVAANIQCGEAPGSRLPNILLINADDLGMGDISCYGSEIPTPNIDSLAREGLLFTDFYVSAPVCTPSRFSQLTGLVPQRSKHNLVSPLLPAEEKDLTRGLEQGEKTIASVLKENGYSTALIGKWHLGHGDRRFMPNAHGFDYFYGFTPGCIDFFTHRYRGETCFYRNQEKIQDKGYVTDLFTNEAVEYIEKNKDHPFYLNLAYNAPHYGKANAPGKASNVLQAPEELIKQFNSPDHDRNVYAAMVKSMDDGIGKVLDTLERLGLSENTLVIFTSDNGGDPGYGGNNGGYRGRKWDLYEGGIRIPCVMRFPGVIKPGTESSYPGSHLDFYKTFSSMARCAETGAHTEGINLMPVIRDNRSKLPERVLYWDCGEMLAVRKGEWKYLKQKETTEQSTEGGEATTRMLFNLSSDPYEKNNLSEKEPALVMELNNLLDSWVKEIGEQ